MSATNQTSNYDLPLFIGTDKPSWLGDFNGAMNAIDTAIKGRADDIDSLTTRMTATETVANTASSNASTALTNASNASSAASSAQTTADNAATAASGAQSTANTALSNAGTAQTTAETANSSAQSALSLANTNAAAIAKLNLTEFNPVSTSDVTANYGTVTGNNVSVATNTDGSVGKVYGSIRVTGGGNSNDLVVSFPTEFRPTSAITINGVCNRITSTAQGLNNISQVSMSIATNGTVTVSTPNSTYVTEVIFQFYACLLFLKDFGDVQE